MIRSISPRHWKEYELLDSGGLEKLERFGNYILARPEPQAVWDKALPEKEWERLAHAWFRRTRGIDPGKTEIQEKGEWIRKKEMPDRWVIHYSHKELNLRFRLGLTAFGHLGVFPEQAANWDFIYEFIRKQLTGDPAGGKNTEFRVLNLFAYTGGASLAAKAAGADVVHVDSVKNVVSWAKEMMELSGLDHIRWVVEDALKFVRRETRRKNSYQGIILDPPAYGRGPEGEKWILQDAIGEMIGLCSELLEKENSFLLFSLYSMGFSSMIAENLVASCFGESKTREFGELFFKDTSGRNLPLGTFLQATF